MKTYEELVKEYRKRQHDTVVDTIAAGLTYMDELAVDSGILEETGILIVSPERLMIMRSSSSVTFLMATSEPVFSVMLRVFTPFAPLAVWRYSSGYDRFP